MQKYIVELAAEQRKELSEMISTGKASARGMVGRDKARIFHYTEW